jgi:hypothetical protein
MRVAIIMSGQPRFCRETNHFISRLHNYTQIDWFVFLWRNNQNYIDQGLDIIGTPWLDIDREWAENKIKENLPNGHYLQGLILGDQQNFKIPPRIYKAPETNEFTTWSMYASQYYCDLMRRQHETQNQFKYDLVIRYRPDMSFNVEIDLRSYAAQLYSRSIITPDSFIWGYNGYSTNDMFAMGSSDIMKTYFNLIHYMFAYNADKVLWHPETMLAYHLDYHQIENIKKEMPIIFRHFGHKTNNVWYSDYCTWI